MSAISVNLKTTTKQEGTAQRTRYKTGKRQQVYNTNVELWSFILFLEIICMLGMKNVKSI